MRPNAHALYVHRTRTSLGRAVRAAYRGNTGSLRGTTGRTTRQTCGAAHACKPRRRPVRRTRTRTRTATARWSCLRTPSSWRRRSFRRRRSWAYAGSSTFARGLARVQACHVRMACIYLPGMRMPSLCVCACARVHVQCFAPGTYTCCASLAHTGGTRAYRLPRARDGATRAERRPRHLERYLCGPRAAARRSGGARDAVRLYVESSRPEASAYSSPRQRQIQRRAASRLGQPRPVGC